MKTFIIAAMLCFIAASAEAGLSTGQQQIESVRNAKAETIPAAKPVQPVKKKQKRRREEDDDDIKIDDIKVDID
jgi:hypothetical protein